MSKVRIEGTFLGQPIDVTITECDTEDAPVGAPVDPTDTPVVDGPAADESPSPLLSGDDAPSDTPGDVTPADPAPAEAESSEVPPNPDGNAEQL